MRTSRPREEMKTSERHRVIVHENVRTDTSKRTQPVAVDRHKRRYRIWQASVRIWYNIQPQLPNPPLWHWISLLLYLSVVFHVCKSHHGVQLLDQQVVLVGAAPKIKQKRRKIELKNLSTYEPSPLSFPLHGKSNHPFFPFLRYYYYFFL